MEEASAKVIASAALAVLRAICLELCMVPPPPGYLRKVFERETLGLD